MTKKRTLNVMDTMFGLGAMLGILMLYGDDCIKCKTYNVFLS